MFEYIIKIGEQKFIIKNNMQRVLLNEAIEYLKLEGHLSWTSLVSPCRSGSCGLCAVKVNGEKKLACKTFLNPGREYKIELLPLDRINNLLEIFFRVSKYFIMSEAKKKQIFESLLLKDEYWNLPIINFENKQILNGYDFKIYKINGITFVVDKPENIRKYGVFPFPDEAELILSYIKENVSTVLDIGSGAGFILLSLKGAKIRIGVDINLRSGFFLIINSLLNGLETFFIQEDITQRFPTIIKKFMQEPVLVTLNLPHAPAPRKDLLPSTSSGGKKGWEIALRALVNILNFFIKQKIKNWKIISLVYSFGKKTIESYEWEINEYLSKCLSDYNISVKVILHNKKIWRINGIRKFDNPMKIDDLPAKAECKFYIPSDKRSQIEQEYKKLVAEIKKEGWNLMGELLIFIEPV